MSRTRSSSAAAERTLVIVARRALIGALAAAFVSVLLVGAPGRYESARAGADTLSAPASPATLPVVGRTVAVPRLMAAARAIKLRTAGLDAFFLGALAIATFGRFRRRTDPLVGRWVRFDAVFALRRGPPLFTTAH